MKTPAQVKKFHKETELGATSDEEISRWLRQWKPQPGCPRFGGVYSNDQLSNPEPNTIYVLNLQNSKQPGSHWTLLGPDGWYMDSYGVVPTKRISKFVKTWNKEDYQGLNQDSCGHYVSYVAWHLMHGMPPMGDLQPGRQLHNENVLERFFYA